jgi:serine/threonine protein kinase
MLIFELCRSCEQLADISPDSELVAKVCDFGVSISAAHHTAGRRVDCPVWLAPEVMENKIYTEKADVYSIGVILWELLTRKAFFGEVSFMSLVEDKVSLPCISVLLIMSALFLLYYYYNLL